MDKLIPDEYRLKICKIKKWEMDEIHCEMYDIDENNKSKLKNHWNNRMRPNNLLTSYLYMKAFDKPHMKSVGTQTRSGKIKVKHLTPKRSKK